MTTGSLIASHLAAVLLGAAAAWLVAAQRRALLPAEAKAPKQWHRLTGRHKAGTAGWTILSALNGMGCLGRSKPEEPVFVLVARDKAAAKVVRYWCALVGPMGGAPAKVADARHIADLMDQWREGHGGKVPD